MEAIEREETNTDQYDDACFHLLNSVSLPDSTKSEVWDRYWFGGSAKDFAHQIAHIDLPESVRAALISARNHREPHAAVVAAIEHLRKIDPEILAAAERHPDLLRLMLGTAAKKSDE